MNLELELSSYELRKKCSFSSFRNFRKIGTRIKIIQESLINVHII